MFVNLPMHISIKAITKDEEYSPTDPCQEIAPCYRVWTWIGYFSLFIVATDWPSERCPQKTVVKCKDTGQNYLELQLVL